MRFWRACHYLHRFQVNFPNNKQHSIFANPSLFTFLVCTKRPINTWAKHRISVFLDISLLL